jgi:hypothetical protein
VIETSVEHLNKFDVEVKGVEGGRPKKTIISNSNTLFTK